MKSEFSIIRSFVIGIHYWDQTRNIQDSLMYENEFTDTNFDDYINCQKENLYQGPMNMTLPFTDQTVSFMVNEYFTLFRIFNPILHNVYIALCNKYVCNETI